MIDATLINRLKECMENEGKSCSFDPELISAEYVYRMWGGRFSMEDIENGLTELREQGEIVVLRWAKRQVDYLDERRVPIAT